MRRLGYRTVDMLIDRLSDESVPPIRRASPAEMGRRLGGPPPERGEPLEDVLAQLDSDVLPFMSRSHHPGFFAFIPSCGTWPGALGDFIASACNIYAGSWMESAGPSQVELELLRWFVDWIGYPESAAGVLLTGGSAANMTALACARESLAGPMSDRLVGYVSDQGHSSLARAARLLGFLPEQVRVLPTDESFRLRPSDLRAAIAADLAMERRPLFLSASAGATNTGAIDPLPELAEVCREHGVWLHADAAYGGFAVLTERGRARLEGLALADSVTLDPHKWLYQPYECGCLLVRDGDKLRGSFEIMPDYLSDAGAGEAEVNFADLGPQLTRSSRALKCWLSLRHFGIAAFRSAIDRSLDLAEVARRRVDDSDALEPTAPSPLGVVCFRRRFEDTDDPDEVDRRNARLVGALERSGEAFVSSTRLNGRYTVRMCVLNHTTRDEDVERTIAFFEEADSSLYERGQESGQYERHRDVSSTWLFPDLAKDPEVASVPLFHGLGPNELGRVLDRAEEREAAGGETIVAQWDLERSFYVILDGEATVLLRGEPIRALGPGDFFGELAALDWGAGYGYSRTATVVAAGRTRMLVFPDGELGRLMGDVPLVAARVEAAVRQRLPNK